jgi:NifU-like protein involved in Fe-S cluster formation
VKRRHAHYLQLQHPFASKRVEPWSHSKTTSEIEMSDFSEKLMEHFHEPSNRRSLENPDLVGKGSMNGHAPFVTLHLRISADKVSEAAFDAAGCGVTIACGSILTELVMGRDHAECSRLTSHQLSIALHGVPTGKEYCADVAIAALRDAIEAWR